MAVGALAVIVAWITRQRKATDAIRKSYETARERFEEAREQLSARGQERGQEETGEEREGTEGHRAYFRKVIEESMERSGLS